MKKISYLLISLIFLINISACTGYKPIFGSSNLEFKIADYSISGDKKLGNKIYVKLYSLSINYLCYWICIFSIYTDYKD